MATNAIPSALPKFFHRFVGNPRLFSSFERLEQRSAFFRTVNNVLYTAPASKWLLSIVPFYAVATGSQPAEKVDLGTSGALFASAGIWSVYGFMISPQNFGTAMYIAVNMACTGVNGYNCYRRVQYDMQQQRQQQQEGGSSTSSSFLPSSTMSFSFLPRLSLPRTFSADDEDEAILAQA